MSIRLGEAHYRFTIDDSGLVAGLKRARARVRSEATAMAGDIGRVGSSFDALAQRAESMARRAEAAMRRVRAAQRSRASVSSSTPSATGTGTAADKSKVEGFIGVINTLGGAVGGMTGKLGPALSGIMELTGAMSKAGPVGTGVAVALVALVAALDQAGKAMIFADEVHDTAERLNITTDSLQAYRFALKLAGGEEKGAEEALAAFSETLGKAQRGISDGTEAFEALGFTQAQVDSFSDADAALDAVREKLSKLSDAQRDAVISQMGLSGMKDLLRESAVEQDRMISKAHEMGAVMDKELVERGNKLNDEFEALQKVIQVQLLSAFVDLGPVLVGLLDIVANMATFAADVADNFRSIPNKTDRGLERARAENQAVVDRVAEAQRRGQSVGRAQPSLKKAEENLRKIGAEQIARAAAAAPGTNKQGVTPKKAAGGGESPPAPRPAARPAPVDRSEEYLAAAKREDVEARRAQINAQLGVTDDVNQRAALQQELLELERQGIRDATARKRLETLRATDLDAAAKLEVLMTLNSAEAKRLAALDIQSRNIETVRALATERATLDSLNNSRQREIAELRAVDKTGMSRDAQREIDKRILVLEKERDDGKRAYKRSEEQQRAQASSPDGTPVITVGPDLDQQAADRIFAAEMEKIEKKYASPLQKYFAEVQSTGEVAEKAAVNGLETFNQGLIDIMTNGGSAIDVLRKSLNRFLADMLDNSLRKIEKKGADWLGGLFEGGFGFGGGSDDDAEGDTGGWLSGLFSSSQARAVGGAVTAGNAYVVGERRAELFVPNVSGFIQPSLMGMGGGGGNAPAGGGGSAPYFDLRGAVMTQDLINQMNLISRRHAGAARKGAVSDAARAAPGVMNSYNSLGTVKR